MNFIYQEDYEEYREILHSKIKDCICKHVMSLDSKKAREVYEESNRIGYKQVVWGYGQGLYKNENVNRIIQLGTIQRMIYEKYGKPFRVVIDKDGTPWIDNLHTALRDIFVYGEDIRIEDTNVYIVDFRTVPVKVINVNGSLDGDVNKILGAINVGQKRLSRITPTLKEINYTIGEFIVDNKLYKSELTLCNEIYREYTEYNFVSQKKLNENRIVVGNQQKELCMVECLAEIMVYWQLLCREYLKRGQGEYPLEFVEKLVVQCKNRDEMEEEVFNRANELLDDISLNSESEMIWLSKMRKFIKDKSPEELAFFVGEELAQIVNKEYYQQ